MTPDPTKPQLRAISAMWDELLNVGASVSVSENGAKLILFIPQMARRTGWDSGHEVLRAAHSVSSYHGMVTVININGPCWESGCTAHRGHSSRSHVLY